MSFRCKTRVVSAIWGVLLEDLSDAKHEEYLRSGVFFWASRLDAVHTFCSRLDAVQKNCSESGGVLPGALFVLTAQKQDTLVDRFCGVVRALFLAACPEVSTHGPCGQFIANASDDRAVRTVHRECLEWWGRAVSSS